MIAIAAAAIRVRHHPWEKVSALRTLHHVYTVGTKPGTGSREVQRLGASLTAEDPSFSYRQKLHIQKSSQQID